MEDVNPIADPGNKKPQADCRTPRRDRAVQGVAASARFCSAAVLCRFSLKPVGSDDVFNLNAKRGSSCPTSTGLLVSCECEVAP